jgi:regulator of protease activity HflC (stomatin/prohibitin superfamily)
MNSEDIVKTVVIGALAILALSAIGSCAYGIPKYRVWCASLAGEAELRRAEQNRQIAIEEANAKRAAAEALAEAEIIRAKGVAEANRIVGESLNDSENYLRYLWIDNIGHTSNQIIYIPTEAGLPILEAGKTNK